MEKAAPLLHGVGAQWAGFLRVRPSQHAPIERELGVSPASTVKMLVTGDISERAAAVGAFLVQRHKAIRGGAGDDDLKLALGVHDFDGAARLAEFRDAGDVDDD